jgi:hypothetical protein
MTLHILKLRHSEERSDEESLQVWQEHRLSAVPIRSVSAFSEEIPRFRSE